MLVMLFAAVVIILLFIWGLAFVVALVGVIRAGLKK